jgi:hypothetical protein
MSRDTRVRKKASRRSGKFVLFGLGHRPPSHCTEIVPRVVHSQAEASSAGISWSKITHDLTWIPYTRDMKKLSFFMLASLSVLAACAPASGPGSDGFPVDRSKRWVLAYSPTQKIPANFYWIDFSKDAPKKDDSLYFVDATAQAFSKGPELDSSFAYASDGKILFANVFLSSSKSVNCALLVNENRMTTFQPTDWVGLGDVGTPSAFFQKIRSKSSDLETCLLIDASSYEAAPKSLTDLKANAGLRQQLLKQLRPVTPFQMRR